MTSHFAKHGTLRYETREAYRIIRGNTANHRRIQEQLRFHYYYLEDIAPEGITVKHCPTDESQTREEIHLLTPSGALFMSGLVSVDYNTKGVEHVAGSEAYTYYLDGEYVPGEHDWRFFVCHTKISFFSSRERSDYAFELTLEPMSCAGEAAAYLQELYDGLRQV